MEKISYYTKTKCPSRIFLAAVPLVVLMLTGCSTAKIQEKKAELEAKKKNFAALTTAAARGEIKIGTEKEVILEKYGEPDNLYKSFSQVSSTEIWTYESGSEERFGKDWRPIRLYFADDKLINLSY